MGEIIITKYRMKKIKKCVDFDELVVSKITEIQELWKMEKRKKKYFGTVVNDTLVSILCMDENGQLYDISSWNTYQYSTYRGY